jgi:4-hydroxy-3-polyprenylbenzoate decarboxylase
MHFVVALTGASGQIYAIRLLQKLSGTPVELSIVLSEPACVTLAAECDIKTTPHSPEIAKLLGDIPVQARIRCYNPRDIGAPMASGSREHDGMVIVPCSMGTLGRIAHGTSEDLIARTADVTLKERRKLLLVTREMPLSLIHLRNMTMVTEAGATVFHACPHFYHRPQTTEEVVDTVVDRVLDHLGVDVGTKRWKDETALDQKLEKGLT